MWQQRPIQESIDSRRMKGERHVGQLGWEGRRDETGRRQAGEEGEEGNTRTEEKERFRSSGAASACRPSDATERSREVASAKKQPAMAIRATGPRTY
ncbi:hypothetical protein K0M31_005046 [Melipona bicolor]|uniref:Uncharacterized protein n=1 Tax=Melipona bicolor TaxID=60889 RepID=A0AA40FW07_9HYME|nr:hypothetical protein K0M31_005046 [Melipona bicolor]